LGVVLMRDGRAEERHHRVADELLDRAAVTLDLASEASVIGGEGCANVLRVELFGAAREPDEVGEQDGDDLPLFSCVRGCERRGAAAAEAEAVRVLLATGGADEHAPTLRAAAARCLVGHSPEGRVRTAAMSASERLRAGAANATSVSRRLTVGLEPQR